MADAYQYTGSLDYSQKAYQRYAYFALRPPLMYDSLADVFATNQSMPGISVQFNILGDLAIASTPINELSDVASVATTDTTVSATLNEYGNAIRRTRALAGTSFIEIDPALARVVGFNGGVSIDEVAKTTAQAGTTVAYASVNGHTGRTNMTSTDIITANDVRIAYAYLLRNNAMPFFSGGAGTDGSGADVNFKEGNAGTGLYGAMIHPDVAYDLRGQTGSGTWRQPSEYAAGFGGGHQGIWSGEIGEFEGFRFVVNPRAPYFANAGNTNQNVLGSLFMGQEALLKIWATVEDNGPRPQIVEGPVVDTLKRNRPLGWYWFGAYGIFRQTCLYRLETAATLSGTTSGGDDPTIDL